VSPNYCLTCAAPLELVSGCRYDCRKGHSYWNNPRAAVGIFLIKDGKILLANRAAEPQKGKYDIIGGFVDIGETAQAAARRELQEETGLIVDGLTYLGSVANTYQVDNYTCDSVFIADNWSGELKANDDVAELSWQSPEIITSAEFAWPAYRDVLLMLEPYLK
jgi:NAD+ diphosphatase